MTEELEPEEKLEQQLRTEYGWFYDRLTAILYSHDPVGLASMGAPEDEYDIEVNRILPQLRNIQQETLATCVYEVFVRMFDEYTIGSRAKFDAIAFDIWNAYQQWLEKPASF